MSKVTKDTNYLSWDNYFMGVALLSSMRSKDPNTKVGACIVNQSKRIIGIGYNGLPYGCSDDEYPWGREGSFLDSKYPYVVHAEPNAILNATTTLEGATLYVTLFPCHECVKLIIQSGIKEIVYMSDKYAGTESSIAGKRMLASANVKCRQMEEINITVAQ
ncbi:MAG: dCMP deaminase family protein [Bacilli bacterium]|jgi:dCMP deaminase|nr:dCMP deaminase family protein [Bacilli bacterium]HHU24680.1 dCMP deaminase family protein [Acholeplasmataceae bacterium]